MIGYYNPSVIATYLSLISSVIGMSLSMSGRMLAAVFFLMLCGLLDMIDGPIARRCKRNDDEKSFGIQIDSLCDVVCFGAQAAVFCLCMAGITWYSVPVAAFFVLTGVIRLGFFNVQEINRQQVDPGLRKVYDGLPITSSSMLMPIVVLIDIAIKPFCGWIYVVAMAVIGFFYIAPVHIPKLHGKSLIVLGIVGVAIYTLVFVFGSSIAAA